MKQSEKAGYTISIVDISGLSDEFYVKSNENIGSLILKYRNLKNIEIYKNIQLKFFGQTLNETKTFSELNLNEDNCVFNVVLTIINKNIKINVIDIKNNSYIFTVNIKDTIADLVKEYKNRKNYPDEAIVGFFYDKKLLNGKESFYELNVEDNSEFFAAVKLPCRK